MASGAGDATLTRVVRDPGLKGGFLNDYAPQYFFRWNGRAAPHNVYTRQDQMLAIAGQGLEGALRSDPALARGLNTYGGAITSRPVAEAHGLDWTPSSSVLPGVAD